MTEHIQSAAPLRDTRQETAAQWASGVMKLDSVHLQPVSGDASFRRYFRFMANGRSIILMDAPSEKENSAPFVDIAGRLRRAGLKAPAILEFDLQQGFGLLEDFGDTLYRELIHEESAGALFPELFDVLDGMARRVTTHGLPQYDEPALAVELDLFKTWYLDLHKDRPMQGDELNTWQ